MINTHIFKTTVEKSGLDREFIAERLNISLQEYQAKEAGQKDFTVGEVTRLKDLLNISEADATKIFFTLSVGEKIEKYAAETGKDLAGLAEQWGITSEELEALYKSPGECIDALLYYKICKILDIPFTELLESPLQKFVSDPKGAAIEKRIAEAGEAFRRRSDDGLTVSEAKYFSLLAKEGDFYDVLIAVYKYAFMRGYNAK